MQIVQLWGIAPLMVILFILSPTEKKQEKAAASPGELHYDRRLRAQPEGSLMTLPICLLHRLPLITTYYELVDTESRHNLSDMATVELLVHCLDVENVFNILAPSFYYLVFAIFMLL